MILTIKTDQPDAEISLYQGAKLIDSYTWMAGRQLSDTLLLQINTLLQKSDIGLKDLKAIIVYHGPGSFTGLRIGISVVNSMAYSLSIPVLGSGGFDWAQDAIASITSDTFTLGAVPIYGAPVKITKQRK